MVVNSVVMMFVFVTYSYWTSCCLPLFGVVYLMLGLWVFICVARFSCCAALIACVASY